VFGWRRIRGTRDTIILRTTRTGAVCPTANEWSDPEPPFSAFFAPLDKCRHFMFRPCPCPCQLAGTRILCTASGSWKISYCRKRSNCAPNFRSIPHWKSARASDPHGSDLTDTSHRPAFTPFSEKMVGILQRFPKLWPPRLTKLQPTV
jgi:hypothetical protein